eukprot:gene12621-6525_t
MSLPKRKRHTAHFCNEKLFFIGGNVAGGCKNANVISEIDVKKNIKDCLLFPVLKLNNFPTKIERHVSVMYNNLIYIFSGILINNRKINNLWTFNPVLHEFNEVECIGDIPCNRCDSCATLENSNMWVFGGSNPDVQPMNDLYRFDIPKKKFELMEVKGDIPDKRSGPVLIYKHEKLFLFGGGQWMNGDWEKRFDDVHKYDIHTSTWSKIDCQSLNRSIETFKTIQIVGEYALLLCGVDEKVWVFNLVSLEWIETEVKAIQGDSQGSTLMNDKIVVHGGHYFSGQKDFYEVDLNFLEWIETFLTRHNLKAIAKTPLNRKRFENGNTTAIKGWFLKTDPNDKKKIPSWAIFNAEETMVAWVTISVKGKLLTPYAIFHLKTISGILDQFLQEKTLTVGGQAIIIDERILSGYFANHFRSFHNPHYILH